METKNYREIFQTLWNDIDKPSTFPYVRPKLAHYTSIENIENILRTDETWFSNPLNMNDHEELRYVVLEANNKFYASDSLRALVQFENLKKHFEYFFGEFSYKHSLDLYAFCFSEYSESDSDGLLSMWRGYGGNGKGAAIVLDTEKLEPKEGSPFIVAKVTYLSKDKRLKWIDDVLIKAAEIITTNNLSSDEDLYNAAYQLFERIKIFALFTKHSGFTEEKEWRVVFLKERNTDPELDKMLGYAKTIRGLEPKLKFKFKGRESISSGEFSISSLTCKIILGPSFSSPMAVSTFVRMLDLVGKPELKEKVSVSDIPFRPI